MSSTLPTPILRDLADRLAAEPGVLAAGLFGSAASGSLRPESDIDVYVRLQHDVRWPLARELALASDLSEIAGREVDLVVEDRQETSVLLRREVARNSKPLLERHPGAWATVRVEGNAAYMDLRPYIERCAAGALQRAREATDG